MESQKKINFVNPVRLCGLVVLILSAPKVLTQTNCECLVLSKHSGVEWIEDCEDTTTEFTSTTYTITTPADVAAPKTTQKPVVPVPSLSTPKTTIKVPVQTTKAVTLTTKGSIQTSKAGSLTTKGSIPTPNPTTKAAVQTTKGSKVTTALITKINTLKQTTKDIAVTSDKSSVKTTLKPSAAGESQAEPVSEPADTGATIGAVVGAVIGVAAVVCAVILFWKLGLLKKFREHYCKRSKVDNYDVENGEATQNGTKPAEKTLKAL